MQKEMMPKRIEKILIQGKNNRLLLLIILLISLNSCKLKTKSYNNEDEKNDYSYFINILENGDTIYYSKIAGRNPGGIKDGKFIWMVNHCKYREYNYINNERNGIGKEFYKNSEAIYWEGSFLNNLKNGFFCYYDSIGNLDSLGLYVDNFKMGDWIIFDKGKVAHKNIYIKDSLVESIPIDR